MENQIGSGHVRRKESRGAWHPEGREQGSKGLLLRPPCMHAGRAGGFSSMIVGACRRMRRVERFTCPPAMLRPGGAQCPFIHPSVMVYVHALGCAERAVRWGSMLATTQTALAHIAKHNSAHSAAASRLQRTVHNGPPQQLPVALHAPAVPSWQHSTS